MCMDHLDDDILDFRPRELPEGISGGLRRGGCILYMEGM